MYFMWCEHEKIILFFVSSFVVVVFFIVSRRINKFSLPAKQNVVSLLSIYFVVYYIRGEENSSRSSCRISVC
jgi:hypothetical protein